MKSRQYEYAAELVLYGIAKPKEVLDWYGNPTKYSAPGCKCDTTRIKKIFCQKYILTILISYLERNDQSAGRRRGIRAR